MADWVPLPQPAPQPQADSLAGGEFRLWRDAPGWRNLMLAAIGFTAAAITLSLIDAPASKPVLSEQACQSGNVGSGEHHTGTTVKLVTPERARYFIGVSQCQAGMQINPDRVSNARIRVRLDENAARAPILVVVPNGMHVGLGDRVEFESGQRDPTLPCHYIPNHVVRDFSQPANSNSKGGQGADASQ